MPGRILQEDYLADDFQIVMRRVPDPEGGALTWVMTIGYETKDDPEGTTVFRETRDDALDLLTETQRTNAINFANTIVARTASLLNVLTEDPTP